MGPCLRHLQVRALIVRTAIPEDAPPRFDGHRDRTLAGPRLQTPLPRLSLDKNAICLDQTPPGRTPDKESRTECQYLARCDPDDMPEQPRYRLMDGESGGCCECESD